MDCQNALRTLEVCRPSGEELSRAELSSAAAHLEDCPDCLAQFRARQQFDTHVGAAMREVAIPNGLRDRIVARLEHRRSRPMVALGPLAAAAAVTLVAGTWFLLQRSANTPPLTLSKAGEIVVQTQFDQTQAVPESIRPDDSAALVAWTQSQLRSLRLRAATPSRWPIGYLSAVARANIEGKRVAVFHYEDPRGSLEIYAFPHQDFDLGDAARRPQPIHRTRNLVVIAWTEQETTYVAVLKNWAPNDWQRLIRQSGGLT